MEKPKTYIISNFTGFSREGIPVVRKPGDPVPQIVFEAKPQAQNRTPSLPPTRTSGTGNVKLPIAG